MSFITTLTRNWLTRSFKPFIFTPEYDDELDYEELTNLGLYVHIPFCKKICSFCPYCKQIYDSSVCDEYVEYLLKEIKMVGSNYVKKLGKKKTVTSVYFGGGSPSLASNKLDRIISSLKEYFDITEGIGIELHPGDITEEKLAVLKKAGISKISIGIQSFQKKFLNILGREWNNTEIMFEALKKVPFETVSMDFIFALPDQTFEDLKLDIETAFSNGANHIAIYPFIDFTFASSNIPVMKKNEKHKLLDEITDYCNEKGYRRDSIWTFSNNESAKYSSMTRENFLGFGCSATTLLKNQFKVNTFNVKEYEKRIDEGKLPTSLTIKFTLRQRMVYYLFWSLYTTRMDPQAFNNFFNKDFNKMYGFEFMVGKILGFLEKEDGIWKLTQKGCFYYHHYENYYTLSYIDKMWGIMRQKAFPEGISF